MRRSLAAGVGGNCGHVGGREREGGVGCEGSPTTCRPSADDLTRGHPPLSTFHSSHFFSCSFSFGFTLSFLDFPFSSFSSFSSLLIRESTDASSRQPFSSFSSFLNYFFSISLLILTSIFLALYTLYLFSIIIVIFVFSCAHYT